MCLYILKELTIHKRERERYHKEGRAPKRMLELFLLK